MSTTSEQRQQIEVLRERVTALNSAVVRISASLDLNTVLHEIATAGPGTRRA